MNLLYLALSLAGVGVLVGLNWLLVRTKAPRLDRAAATALLALDEPTIRLARFAGDGRAALAEDEAGRVFAVAVVGDRLASRRLAKGALARIEARQTALRLTFHDVTFRSLTVPLGEEAADWRRRLEPLL